MSSKIRRLTSAKIRKITGGKDPTRLVEEFLVRRGFDPEECLQQRTSDIATWSVPLNDREELEVTLEGLSTPVETTVYMGLNIFSIPLKDSFSALATALTIADTLIGVKLSAVNYDLVMSVTSYTASIGVDDLDYYYELISRQKSVVQDALTDALSRD